MSDKIYDYMMILPYELIYKIFLLLPCDISIVYAMCSKNKIYLDKLFWMEKLNIDFSYTMV